MGSQVLGRGLKVKEESLGETRMDRVRSQLYYFFPGLLFYYAGRVTAIVCVL